jgi:hypothetical protein
VVAPNDNFTIVRPLNPAREMPMQRKLKLTVEDLSVESFRIPQSHGRERGTVRANSYNPTDPEYDSYDHCVATEPGSDSYGENTCGEYTCEIRCGTGHTQRGWDQWAYDHGAMC